MLNSPRYHRLMFKINVFFVLSNAFFMLVLEDTKINLICSLLALCGALCSYLTYTRLETD